MSKIGKINITIPEKVKVALAGNILNIEGPLGKKSIDIDLETFNLDIKDGKEITIKPKKIDQNTKRLWGMNRSLINNAVIGSSKGYEKVLELVGVGYRAALKGQQLKLDKNESLISSTSMGRQQSGLSDCNFLPNIIRSSIDFGALQNEISFPTGHSSCACASAM